MKQEEQQEPHSLLNDHISLETLLFSERIPQVHFYALFSKILPKMNILKEEKKTYDCLVHLFLDPNSAGLLTGHTELICFAQ